MHNLFAFLHLSECSKPQGDQIDASVDIHNETDNLLPHDIPHTLHHQHDRADTPSPERSDDSYLGDLDEDEQRGVALQAEWDAHAAAIQALSQLAIDQSQTTGVVSELEEVGDSPTPTSRIESIKVTQEFINDIRMATLENGNLEDDVIHRLRNPPEEPTNISDPDIRLSIDLFLAITNASEETYHASRDAILRRYLDSGILSYHAVKKLVAEITGVVAVYDDMCVNSCHAFTGPFAQLESCTICGEPRYDLAHPMSSKRKVPRQQFCTIPLGPQLQALRRSHSGAIDMRYLDRKMKEIAEMLSKPGTDAASIVYDDILCGSEMQDLAERIGITGDDTIVSLSLDGAQLYQNKKSDTWISIWILNNFSPSQRYQKKCVLPGTIIPGPNKPKITDSYLYRGIHHVAALQHENNGTGIHMWDTAASQPPRLSNLGSS
jgi:hypothetical protein